jgi:hypothetical protein
MTNLPSKENQFKIHGYTFSGSEYSIIKAQEDVCIRNLTENVGKRKLSDAILNALVTLGHPKKEDQEMFLLVTKTYNHLLRNYPTIKVSEIELAIDMGSNGEYNNVGDVVFVSQTSVVSWIRRYHEAKKEVFKTLSAAKEKERLRELYNKDSEKERKYWSEFPKMVEDEFNYYKENGKLSEAGFRICKGLEKIGYKDFLKIEAESKRKMYKKEKSLAIAREKQRIEKTQIIVSQKDLNTKNLESEIILNCKENCLKLWFDTLDFIDNEKIKQLID